MSVEDRYSVFNSASVTEAFRELTVLARATGRLPILLKAARWILEELSRTPHEFGESREEHLESSLIFRCGSAPPLFVEYAIHEASRTVFIRNFVLMRT